MTQQEQTMGRSLFGIVALGTVAAVAAIIALLVSDSWWVLAGAYVLLLVMAVAAAGVVDVVTLGEDRR
jgi:hypothetical protein